MSITFAETQITVRPNNSLSPLNSIKLLVVLAVLALLIAFSFMSVGAWLVLPFAGLELIGFAYAFHYIGLRSNDFEVVSVIGDTVVVEKFGYRQSSKAEFQRYWAQVTLRKQVNGMNGLFIGSHGKEVEFGHGFINDEQRVSIAKELKLILKKI